MSLTKDGFYKQIGGVTGDNSYVLLAGGGLIKYGNATGNIPLSNGTRNVDLNADKLDGIHANGLLTAASLGTAGNSITLSVTVGGTTINTGSAIAPYASKTDKVKTQVDSSNATRYITFVDSNNNTPDYEYIYTNSQIIYNPYTGSFGHGSNINISGQYSHAEGCNTTASGQYSHAEGLESTALGARSHAEGHGTTANGPCAHAEGMGTVATGDFTHAEGYQTQSYGRYSHVEGLYCYIATLRTADGSGNGGGEGSHCEGYGSYIMGAIGAHAEGIGTYAWGYHSHTEGKETNTYGTDSHAEGYQSQTGISGGADAQAAHAEGYQTIAKGMASHTSGYGTVANNTAEAAFGKYNVSNSNTIFSVGGGTSSNRYNLFEIRTDGSLLSQNGTILTTANSSVSGGGSTWGSSITVNINGTSKTLTIPSWNLRDIIGSTAIGSISVPIYWTGSSFATVQATFGSQSYGEHNANNINSNGLWYYSSNGPSTGIGASTTDGALYSQAYSTSWVAQIAQDYRNGGLYVRGKNNGTWKEWHAVLDTGHIGFVATDGKFEINPHTRTIKSIKTTNAWDTQVYSTDGYFDNVYVEFKASQTTANIMVGLNSDPTTDANYSSIDYCWYIYGSTLYIFENGSAITPITGHTTYATNDEFRIEYSGGYIRYYHNGIICRVVARAIGSKLYFDSSFNTAGSIYDVKFGLVGASNILFFNRNTDISNLNTVNTESYIATVGLTGGSPTTFTKPTGIDNAFGIIHMHLHTGNFSMQLGFGNTTGHMYFRNAYNTTSFGNWITLLDSTNSSVTGGGSTWGSSITVNINGTSKTLTIPSKPNDFSIETKEDNIDYNVTFVNGTSSSSLYINSKLKYNGNSGILTSKGYVHDGFTPGANLTRDDYVLLAGGGVQALSTLVEAAAGYTHSHTFAQITNKITAGNEFNFVDSDISAVYINYRRASGAYSAAANATVNFNFMQGNAAHDYAYLNAAGFKKQGSDNTKVLLGDGSDKAISDFSSSTHDHEGVYVKKIGDTMTGALTFEYKADTGIIKNTYGTTVYNLIRNHNNGNISLSASTGGLYIGYENTSEQFFYTNGSLRMTIDSAGHIGIGTNMPNYLLHVNGQVGLYEALNFTRDNWNYIVVPSNNGNLGFNVGLAGTTYTKMCVITNGNVGIGTITPGEKLHVNGNVRIAGNNEYIGTGSGSQCHMQYDNTNKCLNFIFD